LEPHEDPTPLIYTTQRTKGRSWEFNLIHTIPMEKKRQQHSVLKGKLLSVTQKNTNLLLEMAELKQKEQSIEAEIKDALTYDQKNVAASAKNKSALEEKKQLLAVARRQEEELQLLRLEINKLKTKCGHVSVGSLL